MTNTTFIEEQTMDQALDLTLLSDGQVATYVPEMPLSEIAFAMTTLGTAEVIIG